MNVKRTVRGYAQVRAATCLSCNVPELQRA